MYEVERKIEVEWARSASEHFPVRMVIHTDDRPGMLNQLTSVLFQREQQYPQPGSPPDDKRDGDGAIVEMTVEIKDKSSSRRSPGAMRRISGVRDIETSAMTIDSDRSGTHRHLQIERHQDRLEGWPPPATASRICAMNALAPPAPARTAPSRRRRTSRKPHSDPVPDVQAGSEDGERGAGGQLRDPDPLERRPLAPASTPTITCGRSAPVPSARVSGKALRGLRHRIAFNRSCLAG